MMDRRAADIAQLTATSLRSCAETLRGRVAMADSGDSVLADCALSCERAAEVLMAAGEAIDPDRQL